MSCFWTGLSIARRRFVDKRHFEIRVGQAGLDIKPYVQRIVLDELAARFDYIAHEVVNICSASTALSSLRSIFSSLRLSGFIVVSKSSFGVHFAQALEALDLDALLPDLYHPCENFGDGEQRLRRRLLAFAFDEFEQRFVLRRIMLDVQALLAPASEISFWTEWRSCSSTRLARRRNASSCLFGSCRPVRVLRSHSPRPYSSSNRFRSRFAS